MQLLYWRIPRYLPGCSSRKHCLQNQYERTLAARTRAHPTGLSLLLPRYSCCHRRREGDTMATNSSQQNSSLQEYPVSEGQYKPYLDAALLAAREAGSVIKDAWNQPKKVEHKGTFDLVTETDKQCENIIHTRLSAAFPTHQFIGEEGSSAQGYTAELTNEPTWMVDPVDGTTNFVHRFPFSCVSIGLTVKKEVVVGVVYNPILDELFHATKDGQAYRNGQPISVSDTSSLQNAVFATEVGTSREAAFLDACFDRIRALTTQMRSVRCCGSCALNLCGVACGRLDAYYELGLGGCWDLAAATLILERAGGKVLDPTGGPFNIMSRRVLGTNAHLAAPVSSILATCKYADSEPKAVPPPQ